MSTSSTVDDIIKRIKTFFFYKFQTDIPVQKHVRFDKTTNVGPISIPVRNSTLLVFVLQTTAVAMSSRLNNER